MYEEHIGFIFQDKNGSVLKFTRCIFYESLDFNKLYDYRRMIQIRTMIGGVQQQRIYTLQAQKCGSN